MKKSDYIDFYKSIDALYSRKECYAKEISSCSVAMTNAHTIQKKRSLENIAENGHVCGFINSDVNSEDAFVFSDKISINEASTFQGFCKKHDDELFKELDTGEIIPTEQQVFLLMFRTIAWQLHNKNCIIQSKKKMINLYSKDDRSLNRSESNLFNSTSKISVILNQILNLMIDNIKINDYSAIQYLVIQTNKIPEIMTSGTFIPDAFIQSLSETERIKPLDISLICMSIFSDSKSGFIVFSWLNDYKQIIENYLSNIIHNNNPLQDIIELCFYQLHENIYFSKNWWNQLTNDQKKLLHSIVTNSNLSNDVLSTKTRLGNMVDWKIMSWKTNNQVLSKTIT